MTAYSSRAAILPLMIASIYAPHCPNMNPPIKTEKNTKMTVPPVTHGDVPELIPPIPPFARYPHPQFGFVNEYPSMIE